MKNLFFIIISALVIISCRSAKKIQTAITKKDTVITVADTPMERFDSLGYMRTSYEKIIENRIGFSSFSAKIHVDYQGADGKKEDVTVFVRMKKDSLIWVSVTGLLGFEGIRAIIEKDSIRILNKLDKTYEVRSMDYLQELTSLPLTLPSMQDLIIGNPVFLDTNFISFTNSNNAVSLLTQGIWFKHLITFHERDHQLLSSKLDDADVGKTRTALLNYAEYENKTGVQFSMSRNISVVEKTQLNIKLSYKQYAFNEMLSFPFSIPKNYKKI